MAGGVKALQQGNRGSRGGGGGRGEGKRRKKMKWPGVFGKYVEGRSKKREACTRKPKHNEGAAKSPSHGSSVPWETHTGVEGLIGCLI